MEARDATTISSLCSACQRGGGLRAGAVACAVVVAFSFTACLNPAVASERTREAARHQAGRSPLFVAHQRLVRRLVAAGGPHLLAVRRPDGRAVRLRHAAKAPLVGFDRALAQLRDDRRVLAYDTWTHERQLASEPTLESQGLEDGDPLGMPRVRLQRLTNGRQTLLEEGTMTPALGPGGLLGYVRSDDPYFRANRPFLTRVEVRAGISNTPMEWSQTPDRYFVLGWARRHLIVRRDRPMHFPQLLVFDGPGSQRVLANDADFVAISPDGKLVLVAIGHGEQTRLVVYRVSDGGVVAALSIGALIDPVLGRSVHWVLSGGEWRGDLAVLPTESGAAVVRFAKAHLEVVRVIHVDDTSGSTDDTALLEPRLANRGKMIIGWRTRRSNPQAPRIGVQDLCDIATATCAERVYAAPDVPRPVSA